MAKRQKDRNGTDPTENVIALAEASSERADQLRLASERLFASQIVNLEKRIEGHAKAQAKLNKKESQRIDSIRRVDREDVNKIATTTSTTAETLRAQVAATASAAAVSLANSMGEVNKRLSALELSYSEGRGKATVESPMMAEMVAEIKALREDSRGAVGEKKGVTSARDIITWVLISIIGLITLYNQFKPH